jgi:AbrB family looped-hinge helix DNA binding protein
MREFTNSEVFGAAVVGERGQVVIPADIRKLFKVKPGDRLIVIAHTGRMIGLIPSGNFSRFLNRASEIMEKLDNKTARKTGRP